MAWVETISIKNFILVRTRCASTRATPFMQHSLRFATTTGAGAVVGAALLFGLALLPHTAHASPLAYLGMMCTMDESKLEAEVESMVQQLRWTRRFSGPGSQFRKHIEGHAGEVMEALESLQTRDDCSQERKTQATNLWAMLSATRSGY